MWHNHSGDVPCSCATRGRREVEKEKEIESARNWARTIAINKVNFAALEIWTHDHRLDSRGVYLLGYSWECPGIYTNIKQFCHAPPFVLSLLYNTLSSRLRPRRYLASFTHKLYQETNKKIIDGQGRLLNTLQQPG